MIFDITPRLALFLNKTDDSTRRFQITKLKSKSSYHVWIDLYFFTITIAYGGGLK